MENLDFVRCRALNNIPQRKLHEAIKAVEESQDDLQTKSVKQLAINRYFESNIPLEYWTLKMDRNFKGDPRLLERYNEYVADLKAMYVDGTSVCFAGGHGLGKTMTITCILKKAAQKGFSCLYTTLSDIVSVMTAAGYGEDRTIARRELAMVDFLAIDEFDPRFMPTENAADLYARSLENVFRARSQNKLPTLMGTNSPNPIESFNGPLKASIDSLMKGYLQVFAVSPGKDFRKEKA
jgi:DNA replication protein DnaC